MTCPRSLMTALGVAGLAAALGASARGQIPPGYEVIQITDNPHWEDRPRINNRGQFVFYARLTDEEESAEIFFYDGSELIRLTDDDVEDTVPDINDEGTIA